jgi:uncharacterized protein YcbX
MLLQLATDAFRRPLMHRIAEIFRYPVKSMLGEGVPRARLTAAGIIGDRAWALKDERRGGITGGKRFPALMAMSARFLQEPGAGEPSAPVVMSDPAGASRPSTDVDIDSWLSARLDHPVSLWPLLPAAADAHYRREAPEAGADPIAGLREVFARTADEPLPDVSRFPPVLATHSSPPGTYFDAFPLLIMSRSALLALELLARAAGSQSVFDVRRFRPNLLLETTVQGFVEDAWCGRLLRVGGVVLKVEMTCPRCIMTTHGFLDLPRDPKIMRSLVLHHGGDLGVYASVVEPGEVRAGDVVELC